MSACVRTACVCVYVAPFIFQFRPSVHPSTKIQERAGKERKVVERGRKGSNSKILHLTPMQVAMFVNGRCNSNIV